jgi:hypothetical protein
MLLWGLFASSRCLMLLWGLFASSRCLMLLWGLLASSRCLMLLWGLLASSRCLMLLWGLFASSRRQMSLPTVPVTSAVHTDRDYVSRDLFSCAVCTFCCILLLISLLSTASVSQHSRGDVVCATVGIVHVHVHVSIPGLGVAIRKFETQRGPTGSVRNGVQKSSGRCQNGVSGLPRAVNCLPMCTPDTQTHQTHHTRI